MLADIVDNSISAGATKVDIQFDWAGEGGAQSRILILDDGRGMDDAELESAMRLGDKNPLDTRAAHDLGRFGMGLIERIAPVKARLMDEARGTSGELPLLLRGLPI